MHNSMLQLCFAGDTPTILVIMPADMCDGGFCRTDFYSIMFFQRPGERTTKEAETLAHTIAGIIRHVEKPTA